MRSSLRAATVTVVTAAVLSGGSLLGADPAHAYGGKAVAQIEISVNCNNAAFCQSNLGFTGGFWIWTSLNSDAGQSTDFTFAACGHTVGGPNSGASSDPGTGTWTTEPALGDLSAIPLAITSPAAQYYVISFPGIGLPDVAVPTALGHYNNMSFLQPDGAVPGVSVQVTVAP